jgi:hypothetical protein
VLSLGIVIDLFAVEGERIAILAVNPSHFLFFHPAETDRLARFCPKDFNDADSRQLESVFLFQFSQPPFELWIHGFSSSTGSGLSFTTGFGCANARRRRYVLLQRYFNVRPAWETDPDALMRALRTG